MVTTTNDTAAVAFDDPQGVLHLLRDQVSLYGELEALSSRQRLLVVGEDVGPLLSLLADRQRLSERLARIAVRLAGVRQEWPRYRARLSPVQRAEADKLVGEAGTRLRRVIECDEHDARVLSGRKQTVREALKDTHGTSRAIAAYRVATAPVGRLDGASQQA